MLVLGNGDKLRGDASATTIVDYTVHGLVGSTLTLLANGQLSSTTADIYTSAATVVISAITIVNTDTVARTINLYLTPSGGTARRLIAKNMSIGAGYSVIFDGQKFSVMNTFGQILYTSLVEVSAQIWLPAEMAYLPTTTGTFAESFEVAGSTTYPGYSVLRFDDTNLEKAMWRLPVPSINTTMSVTIYWIANTAGSGNVVWKVGATGINDNEVFTTATVPTLSTIITDAAPSDATKMNIITTTGVTTNATNNEMLLFLIERTGSDVSDTLTGDANLFGVLLAYTKV